MRLAYFTPLPPSKSGIADYNAELLPYLAKGAEITVFVEQADELRENQDWAVFSVQDAVHFDEINHQDPFDLCVYHQGNNPHHEYIYERALEKPGLLTLHESCLHHLIAWKTLGREDKDAYWDEMFYAYGRPGGRLSDMRDDAVASDYQQFLMPLNHRVIQGSLGVIVHNAYAASQLEGASEGTPVEIIPHHLSPKAYDLDRMDKIECRRSLGIPDDAWVIASFGFVTESKRIPTVLAAFKHLSQHIPNAMFLVVGEDHWRWSVAPLIEEMGLQTSARITGYTTERDFFRYLKAVDVMVNLRYPTAGETSGTLIRALGAGIPAIVTDFAQFADLPDDICLKVAATENEERELYLRMRALAQRPTLRERLSQRSAEWIRGECEISRSAARYLNFAERIVEKHGAHKRSVRQERPDYRLEFKESPTIKLNPDEALNYVAGFYSDDADATGYIQLHRDRLIRTVELVPVGDRDQRLLELSSYLQMPLLVKRYGDYGEVAVTNWWDGEPREKIINVRNKAAGEEYSFPMKNVDVDRDPFPFDDNYFDVALCCELIEHLREDPMHMLIELNRVVKWGGLLVLTTPNITSAFSVQEALAGRSPNIYSLYNRRSPADRHSREYTPADVRTALEAAGFKVLKLFTENVWHKTDEEFLAWLDHTDVPRELRGDNIYAVGRKQSLQIERYPYDLYE
ncbi:MAG: methyltransferase domain-containing protein [Acidobacteria bacterium]|nr:methyltransferase domain-containing protein [Acidobacteriota bacterium]